MELREGTGWPILPACDRFCSILAESFSGLSEESFSLFGFGLAEEELLHDPPDAGVLETSEARAAAASITFSVRLSDIFKSR